MHCGKYSKGLSLTFEFAELHSRYVTIVTENGDVGIFKTSFLELNGQSVVDLNT